MKIPFKSLGLILAVFLLLTTSAFAAVTLPTTVTAGNDRQDRVKDVTTTMTITNTGTAAVTVNSLTTTADVTKYNVRFTGTPTTIAASSTGTVTITANIPLDHPAVDAKTLKVAAIEVGTITLQTTEGSNAAVTTTSKLLLQAKNQLEIDDADIDCDGISASVDDGDDVENLKPDMDCTVTVSVENNFRESDVNSQKIGDIRFPDIRVTIEIDDPDFDEDEDEDIDNLDAGDDDEVSLDFEIDEDADDGSFSMKLRVEGRDENGALHGEEFNVDLEVERLTHDLQMKSYGLTPTTVTNCADTTARASLQLSNVGTRDERDAAVEIDAGELKFTDKRTNVEIDEDDSRSFTFSIPVKRDTKPGLYSVTARTFFDENEVSNTATADLTVVKCTAEEEEEEEEPVVVTPPTPQPQTPPTPPAPTPRPQVRSNGFTESPAYLYVLGGAVVLVVIIIVVLLASFARRK